MTQYFGTLHRHDIVLVIYFKILYLILISQWNFLSYCYYLICNFLVKLISVDILSFKNFFENFFFVSEFKNKNDSTVEKYIFSNPTTHTMWTSNFKKKYMIQTCMKIIYSMSLFFETDKRQLTHWLTMDIWSEQIVFKQLKLFWTGLDYIIENFYSN